MNVCCLKWEISHTKTFDTVRICLYIDGDVSYIFCEGSEVLQRRMGSKSG